MQRFKMTFIVSRIHLVVFAVTMASAVALGQNKRFEFSFSRTMSVALGRRSLELFMNRQQYCESTNVTLEDQRESLKCRIPAPIDESLSKYQIEFRKLLAGILYTEKETETVLNPRFRTILKGIAASYYEPDVYRAFEILYEDYIPLRVAGRVVYRELQKVVDESKQYKQSQIDSIIKVTGMTQSDIENCWSDFTQLTSDRELSLRELKKCIKPEIFIFVSERSRVSPGTEAEKNGTLSFEQLMIYLYDDGNIRRNASGNGTYTEKTSAGNILQQVLDPSYAIDKRILEEQRLSPKDQKYNRRYDDMLKQFSKWKSFIPSGDGRRLQILRGCFVGSENPAVVEALRVIYVDYAALRLSGDWIFKVVSALMGPIERRHNRRENKLPHS